MKNNKSWVVVGCLVLLGIGFYFFSFSHSSAKRDCEEKISYSPASESEGALGKSKVDEHYVFTDSTKTTPLGTPYTKLFKTHQEAIRYCISYQANLED